MDLKDFKNTNPMEHIKRIAQLKTIAGTKERENLKSLKNERKTTNQPKQMAEK